MKSSWELRWDWRMWSEIGACDLWMSPSLKYISTFARMLSSQQTNYGGGSMRCSFAFDSWLIKDLAYREGAIWGHSEISHHNGTLWTNHTTLGHFVNHTTPGHFEQIIPCSGNLNKLYHTGTFWINYTTLGQSQQIIPHWDILNKSYHTLGIWTNHITPGHLIKTNNTSLGHFE